MIQIKTQMKNLKVARQVLSGSGRRHLRVRISFWCSILQSSSRVGGRCYDVGYSFLPVFSFTIFLGKIHRNIHIRCVFTEPDVDSEVSREIVAPFRIPLSQRFQAMNGLRGLLAFCQ